MISIIVSSLRTANEIAHQFDAIISVENSNATGHLKLSCVKKGSNRLRVVFDDIDFPVTNLVLPQLYHIQQTLDFVSNNIEKDLLIHCDAGRSRSCAIALCVLAHWYGPGRETEAVSNLLEIAPKAAPNKYLLSLCDTYMERRGNLINAVYNTPILFHRQKVRERLFSIWRKHL